MYTSFYSLNKKPFQISSDPEFIWLGEKHKEALATLRYGILDNKGFLLLTGDVGTGKTTLINTLISSLTEDVILASVPDPRLESLDFFNYIAVAFGINEEFSSKGKFVIRFSEFLHNAYKNNKKVLLIIDEAQLLSQDLLEEIRLLSNINVQNSQILNIFFVGQNEFNEIIAREENRAVSNRLTLNYHLGPLTLGETGQYIQHRLNVAGAVSRIFNRSAIKQIFEYSGGLPRRINIICDHCLITGFVSEKTTIEESDVKKSIQDLSIPRYTSGKEIQTTGRGPSDSVSGDSSRLNPDIETVNNQKEFLFGKLTLTCLLLILIAGCLIYLFPARFVAIYSSVVKGPFPVSAVQDDVTHDTQKGSKKEILPEPPPPELHEQEGSNSLPAVAEISKPGSTAPVVKVPPAESSSMPPDKKIVEKGVTNAEGDVPLTERVFPVPVETVGEMSDEPSSKNEELPTVAAEKEVAPQLPEDILVIRFRGNGIGFDSIDVDLLEAYVRYLKANPSSVVSIAGHTDSSGTIGFNLRLSEFRAEVVKSYLVGRGVAPSQTRVEGFGPTNPVASNDTEEGRRQNRRVEVTFLPR